MGCARAGRWRLPPLAHALRVRSLRCSALPPSSGRIPNARFSRLSGNRLGISTGVVHSRPTWVTKSWSDRRGLAGFVDRGRPSHPDNDAPSHPSESCHAVIDRLPPQSLEAEQSVLGAILIDRDAVVEVAEFLRPDDFYRQANARIYSAILDLFERREPIDIVTVAEALERARSSRRSADGPTCPACPTRRRPPSMPPSTRGSSNARRSFAASSGRRAGSPASATRIRPRSRRRSTAPRRSCSRSARSASTPGSARSRRCCTTPTTDSTTCTPTAARSAACGPASRTSTR